MHRCRDVDLHNFDEFAYFRLSLRFHSHKQFIFNINGDLLNYQVMIRITHNTSKVRKQRLKSYFSNECFVRRSIWCMEEIKLKLLQYHLPL